MPKRFCIHHLPASAQSRRRIILVSQGEWSHPILDCHAVPGTPLTLSEFISHCHRTGRHEVLERIRAKAQLGLPVWMNNASIPNREVCRVLAEHTPSAV